MEPPVPIEEVKNPRVSVAVNVYKLMTTGPVPWITLTTYLMFEKTGYACSSEIARDLRMSLAASLAPAGYYMVGEEPAGLIFAYDDSETALQLNVRRIR